MKISVITALLLVFSSAQAKSPSFASARCLQNGKKLVGLIDRLPVNCREESSAICDAITVEDKGLAYNWKQIPLAKKSINHAKDLVSTDGIPKLVGTSALWLSAWGLTGTAAYLVFRGRVLLAALTEAGAWTAGVVGGSQSITQGFSAVRCGGIAKDQLQSFVSDNVTSLRNIIAGKKNVKIEVPSGRYNLSDEDLIYCATRSFATRSIKKAYDQIITRPNSISRRDLSNKDEYRLACAMVSHHLAEKEADLVYTSCLTKARPGDEDYGLSIGITGRSPGVSPNPRRRSFIRDAIAGPIGNCRAQKTDFLKRVWGR